MASVERVTITLPNDLVRDIDRREKNRGKFGTEAVRHELDRRRRAELRRSLQNPHPESVELAEQGLPEWTRVLPEEDAGALVDSSGGTPVRCVSGEGWVEQHQMKLGRGAVVVVELGPPSVTNSMACGPALLSALRTSSATNTFPSFAWSR